MNNIILFRKKSIKNDLWDCFLCYIEIMTLAKRIKIKYNSQPEETTREEKALDLLGGFQTMIATSLDNNKKFPINEILFQWWKIAFKKIPITELPVSCAIIKISSQLYFNSCKELKLLTSKNFIKLNREIQSDEFNDYSQSKLNRITKLLTEITLLEINTSKGGA